MENIDLSLLKEIAGIEDTPKGAYNIRKNGKGIERKVTENINIKLAIKLSFKTREEFI